MVKEIKDFPDYLISDTGEVYSKNYHRSGILKKLKPGTNGYGYLRVTLCKDGKHYLKLVHRLVAETFIRNPDNKPQVNHKNGNKADNRVENLEFCTCSENNLHKFRVLGYKKTNLFGKDNPNSKIILQIQDGKVIAEFYGSGEASRATGISCPQISNCCRNKKYYKSAGGYKWRYKNNT